METIIWYGPPPGSPCEGANANDICKIVSCGCGATYCDCSYITTSPPQVGIPYPPQPFIATSESSADGAYHAAVTGAPGSGSFFFRYHNSGSQVLGVLEVRSVDGTITRYARFGTLSDGERYRPVERVDPHDNVTKYEYDGQGRLARVQHPHGVDEVWNYSPSWIGGANGWNALTHTGIEVTYEDATSSTGPELEGRKYFLLFSHNPAIPLSKPFAGDRLIRVYSPKQQLLDGPPAAGAVYPLPAGAVPERHMVIEFSYHPNSDLVSTISHRLAVGPEFGAAETAATTIATFTYQQNGSLQPRVLTETLWLRGPTTHTFAYTTDSEDRVDTVVRTDALGGSVTRTLDDQQRTLTLTIVPPSGSAGRPRASDPDNGGHAEPTAVSYTFQYSACQTCDKPVVVEQQPSNRRDEYDYDAHTGLLRRHRYNDPRGLPGLVETVYDWEPSVASNLQGSYRLKSVTTPDGSVWNYSYVTQPRATPADRVSWGVKPQVVTVTSPIVDLADGTAATVVTSHTYDVSTPPTNAQGRQTAWVGQLLQTIDGNGLVTTYSLGAFGYTDTVTANPGGLTAEVVSKLTLDRLGNVVTATENFGSSHAVTTTFARDSSGVLVERATPVGSQALVERFYYDSWGNLAVHLRSNQNSSGSLPDDLGQPGRPDLARAWLRDEWHYDGDRLVTRLRDRRTLDRSAVGPVADDPDAVYLKEDYLWLPNGELGSVAHGNGSISRFTYDGYGWLYKAELVGPDGDLLIGKYFVNAAGELVREVRDTGSELLITSITRNTAGGIESVSEPVVAAPSGYPAGWAVAAALYEFDFDVMGQSVERRLLRAPGGVGNLLRREVASFDALGRLYRTQVYEGSSPAAAQVHSTQWEGVSQVAQVTGPGGRFVAATYDSLGRLSELSDSSAANPNKTHYSYNDKTFFVSRVEQQTWDQLTAAYVTRGVSYLRDPLGRVLEVQQGPPSAPLVHRFAYYSTGATESYQDPLGNVERYLPDALGRLTERLRQGTPQIFNTSSYLDWSTTDNQTELVQVDGRGRLTRTIHDFAGRVLAIMEPGATTQPTSQGKHQDFAQFHEYDKASRLVSIYGADGVQVLIDRDAMGRPIQRTATGTNSWVSLFYGGDRVLRDALGQVVYTRSFDMGGLEYLHEEFERDALGRTHRESFAYYPGYANWTDIESTYVGGDPLRTGLFYENNLPGNADDVWIDVSRDSIGRIGGIRWRVGEGDPLRDLAKYKYDGARIRERQTTLLSTHIAFETNYTYDAYGRMQRIDQSFDPLASTIFHFDDASNLTKEEYKKQGNPAAKGDRFVYDEHNRLRKAWLGSDQLHFDQVDPEGALGNYIKRLTYDLDAANNRSNLETQSGAGGPIAHAQYSTQDAGENQGESNRYDQADGTKPLYDGRGNTIFDGTRYYVYDALNRLTEVYVVEEQSQQALAAGAQAGQSAAVAEESVGGSVLTGPTGPQFIVHDVTALKQARNNILSRMSNDLATVLLEHEQSSLAQSASEPINPALVELAVPAAAAPAPVGGFAPGATASASTSSSVPVFQSLQLRMIALYLYDSYGRRVMRMVEGWPMYYYAWDGWEEAQEMTFAVWVPETGSPYAVTRPITQNVWGTELDELVAYRHRDGVLPSNQQQLLWRDYYVAEGGAHCPSRVLNGQGAVVEIQEYDPHGKTTFFNGLGAPTGDYTDPAVWNLFHWKGHRVDWETGLVYMRHRYYAPSSGRFVTGDPLGVWGDAGGLGNHYQYAYDNPMTLHDPSGLQVAIGNWIGQELAIKVKTGEWSETAKEVIAFEAGVLDVATEIAKGAPQQLQDMATLSNVGSVARSLVEAASRGDLLDSAVGRVAMGGPELMNMAIEAGGQLASDESRQRGQGFAKMAVIAATLLGVRAMMSPRPGTPGASGPGTPGASGPAAPKPSAPTTTPQPQLPVPTTGVARACPEAIHVHHLLPQSQRLRGFFKAAGLNIEEFTVRLSRARHILKPSGVHTRGGGNWNKVWAKFFERNPGASKEQILKQLTQMRKDFGI
ncbi:MAG: DUF2380 domain-containing protein [Planctomycetes bacterium]|nr:DUF2380 domain-containing protein [Planctomycetota bacterium]